ncbi:hypothetical protein QUF61_03770 [Candidatus Venteria ishoeyi]|uniref:hypothetical protein n=1 Tax=Candidatus Venteria ishoeyi TaxID=1899563 RepID=UPI0025A523C9|nr:hypothetical protein [Candidatus Venteria ishoeyi]MDM8545592.1 hypothetical protein [Candidatus Venteria ishoeyi]
MSNVGVIKKATELRTGDCIEISGVLSDCTDIARIYGVRLFGGSVCVYFDNYRQLRYFEVDAEFTVYDQDSFEDVCLRTKNDCYGKKSCFPSCQFYACVDCDRKMLKTML